MSREPHPPPIPQGQPPRVGLFRCLRLCIPAGFCGKPRTSRVSQPPSPTLEYADFSFLFSQLPCPIRHLHPSREQAFVAGTPSTTNTTRSTSPGWPFSLPKALYSRGFLRKAADFESQPATLSYPGFLSDSAIPLCFREGEHEAKSGSPRHTVPGDTGAWTRAPMKPSARAVFGVAECQWSYSSIPGTPPIATVSRPSVMAPEAARSTRQAPPARCRAARCRAARCRAARA